MSEMSKIAADLRNTSFLEDLLGAFVDRGLGSLPGRETTIALVQLLLEHHPKWKKRPPRGLRAGTASANFPAEGAEHSR